MPVLRVSTVLTLTGRSCQDSQVDLSELSGYMTTLSKSVSKKFARSGRATLNSYQAQQSVDDIS